MITLTTELQTNNAKYLIIIPFNKLLNCFSRNKFEISYLIPFAAVPGKPTGVTLLEAVKDYMVLGWTAPDKDGGADIRGYFVDYRTVKGDVVSKWNEMNLHAVTTTSFKVSSFI